MQLTWERVIPDAIDQSVSLQRHMLEEHLERYRFASKFVSRRRVIDAACGAGYGSRMLREAGAIRVLGLDIAPEAVAYAEKRYGENDVEFQVADLENSDLAAWDFDVFVSFETIEHLNDPENMLRRIRQALRPDGLLVASVPTVPSVDINEFHKHDFTRESWRCMVERAGFQIKDDLLQRYCASFADLAADRNAPNSPKSGARRHPARYYLSHPVSLAKRVSRLIRYGMEFEVLTLACSPLA